MTTYALHDLTALRAEAPPDSILSRTFFTGEGLKAILFGFAPGQELSEHTAAVPAIVHILAGEAELTLGQDRVEAHPGTWAHMPARLPHSVRAKTPVTMLLLMLRAEARPE
jgi:quercetin dioxygenase-like cupin family protein